ncbi:M15 family metallopeptidase [Lysinibacillus sp. LZ02]|uniref:M15 family metallopeptidase n=1 Tax=Lysinibacillus sp. LZ02 TaxID=3420668 RepID=UPI003D35ABA1
MRKSRIDRHKNNKPIMVVSSIVIFLVVIVVGIYAYKDTLFPSKAGEQSVDTPPAVAQPNEMEENEEQPTTQQEEPPEVIEVDAGGYRIEATEVIEPTYVDGVLLANKKHPLPKDFNPGESPEARAAFEQMAMAAKEVGLELVAFSGFRSYDYQTTLYTNYVNRDGKEAADRYSARPGYSEHQTGLAFDIGENSRQDLWLTAEFGETPAGKWLVDNAHKYGFILRFPEGKEDVTGFMYESWHFRYLGVEAATKVKKSGLTLEEYLGVE